ncbi:hypothetical protein Ga0123462_0466 [Mariprofundus ferrinatatus]|uniref:Small metal-binding protein n=1 Tax=Mariprofundus ferrinatatus TaxID=1921087 RepID=A0A2K8L673_9PROT|nr:hypothetical protein [Mariprofundus ferrinatatus]ATX81341.1 hypothetical protein Ga0123462_0466 [Mariprofundus ferrinatatus]
MKKILLLFSLLAFAMPAQAGMFTSIEDRAQQLRSQLEGNNSYHAHLARELTKVALEEKAQHDTSVAKEFMRMAEDHASQAGGAQ